MRCVEGWFRALPKVADREGASAVVHEAQALPRTERVALMEDFNKSVWRSDEDEGKIDTAFERWRAQRRK